MPFGCWWFLNTSSLVTQITRQRIELLGTTFVAQHSDARVLEHLIYKWRDARRLVAGVLSTAYEQLAAEGYSIAPDDIVEDAKRLFGDNFWSFTASKGFVCHGAGNVATLSKDDRPPVLVSDAPKALQPITGGTRNKYV
jgi:hypothetical protein